MLNEPLEEYKKLYSEYITHLAGVHYFHQNFINGATREGGHRVRENLRKMSVLQKRMIRLSIKAFQRGLEINRIKKREAKQEAKRLAENSKKRKVKKNDNNIRTNKTTS